MKTRSVKETLEELDTLPEDAKLFFVSYGTSMAIFHSLPRDLPHDAIAQTITKEQAISIIKSFKPTMNKETLQ